MTPERLLSIVLGIGFLAAPALALLYGPVPGLVVLMGSLAITIGLARSARSALADEQRRRVDLMLKVNGILLAVTAIALLVLIL